MNGTSSRLAPLVLLGCLTLFSGRAIGDEIPFYVTNDEIRGETDRSFICLGPWFRRTPSVKIEYPLTRKRFYSAQVNSFSPFGHWGCNIHLVRTYDFCLQPSNSPREVDLHVVTRGVSGISLRSNQPSPPCTVAAASAFLGEASGQGQTGQGTFRVEGTAGDTISVMVDHDGSDGSTGEIAQLRLITEGGTILAEQQGAVPLQLSATLPSSGALLAEAVAVATSAAGSGGAFRGYYLLTVTDNSGDEVQLEPLPPMQP